MNSQRVYMFFYNILITVSSLIYVSSQGLFSPSWIDDAYLINGFSGLYSNSAFNPIFRTFYFIDNLLIGIQGHVSDFNVYLFFLLVLLGSSIFMINHLIMSELKHNKMALTIVFSALLVSIVVLESTLLLNFTAIGLLSFCVSFILVIRKRLLFYSIPLVLISFLVRPEMAFLAVPLLIIGLSNFGTEKTTIYLGVGFMCAALLLIRYDDFQKLNAEFNRQNDVDLFVGINILDGNNFDGPVDRDNARHLALFTWFGGDVYNVYNHSTLRELKPYAPFSIKSVSNGLRKLKLEYSKACYRFPDDYASERNWLIKGLLGVLLLMIISVYFAFRSTGKLRLLNLVLFSVFCFEILASTVFYKMEFRVLHPLLVSVLFLLLVINANQIRRRFLLVSIAACLALLPFRVVSDFRYSCDIQQELSEKTELRHEINTKFKDKIILLDFLTSALLQPTLVGTQRINTSGNELLLYGEVFYNFRKAHLNYLQEFCGDHEIVPFFKCLYNNRENVVFAFTSIRVEMYQKYFRQVYNLNVRFKKLEDSPNNLNTLNYSYLWSSIDADYYVFDKSFEDF